MLKHLVLIAVMLSSAAANAAIGPPVAYVKINGTSREVWLSNSDGSGAKRLYAGPSKTYIGFVDIRPGGGQLAFKEGTSVIRIIDYDASGTAMNVSAAPQSCTVSGLDYHPTDGSILYASNCNGGRDISYKRYDGAGITTLLSLVGGAPQGLCWLHDGSGFLWIMAGTGAPNGPELRKSSLTNPSAWTVLFTVPTGNSLNWVDVANTSNTLLLTDGNNNIHKLTFSDFGATDQGVVIKGMDGHFSADDSQILFTSPTVSNSNSVQIRNSNGTTVNVTSKGSYGTSAWRQ